MNEPYQPKWHLEKRIWEAISYIGRDPDYVASLKQRLPGYFDLTPLERIATRTGFEQLADYVPIQVVEQVVRAKFDVERRYRKKEDKRESRAGGYKGAVAKGIKAIFDGESLPSFLKPDVREKRDWLVIYAAILDMMDYENQLAATVSQFVDAVNTLLIVYNNLEIERSNFFLRIGVPLSDGAGKPKVKEVRAQYGLRGIVANIERNRKTLNSRTLRDMASKDKVIKELVDEVMEHSYSLSEILLMNLFGHATSDFKGIGIDLNELEEARIEIGRQIREDPQFDSLRQSVRDFYLGSTKITSMTR